MEQFEHLLIAHTPSSIPITSISIAVFTRTISVMKIVFDVAHIHIRTMDMDETFNENCETHRKKNVTSHSKEILNVNVDLDIY